MPVTACPDLIAMTLRQQRFALYLASVAVCVTAVATVGWLVTRSPGNESSLAVVERTVPLAEVDAGPAASPSIDPTVWQVRLRQPLVDPPPVDPTPVVVTPEPVSPPTPVAVTIKPAAKPKPPKPQAPPLGFVLVGTILEADRPVAIVEDAAGTVDLRKPGETFELDPGGVYLSAVGEQTASVVWNGKARTLRLDDDDATERPVRRDRSSIRTAPGRFGGPAATPTVLPPSDDPRLQESFDPRVHSEFRDQLEMAEARRRMEEEASRDARNRDEAAERRQAIERSNAARGSIRQLQPGQSQ